MKCQSLFSGKKKKKKKKKNIITLLEAEIAQRVVKVKGMSLIVTKLVGLGGSVGCAVRLETRRSRVQPPPRSATFFRGD